MPALLELFSGTGSVGTVFRDRGWTVTSLDCDKRAHADIRENVLTWDYRAVKPGTYDCVWASPPCTEYSRARTCPKPRDLEGADAIVRRTLEIIAWLRPKAWWIENPATGLLPKREVVAGLEPPHIVSYCRYGRPFRKDTALWSNVRQFEPLRCHKACGAWTGNGHATTAQRRGKDGVPGYRLAELHAIPRPLVEAVEEATSAFIRATEHGEA